MTEALVDTGATSSVPHPLQLSHSLPWSKTSIQIVGIANQPTSIFKAEPVPFQLGNFIGNAYFYSSDLLQFT